MDDLISRQALCKYALNQKDKSVTPNDIMRFPSAQPEADEWCADCKEYDHDKHCCPRWNRVIRTALEEAQPERKKGEWEEIEVIADAYDISGVKTWASKMMCGQCGFTTIAIEGHFSQYNYCPNCGADMRGEEHE